MSNSEALNQLLSPEQRKQDEKDERRARFIQVALVLILLIIVGTWVWGIVWSIRQPAISSVEISNMQVVGQKALCPGDILQIEYDFHADGAGLLDFDATAWRIAKPPKTIVFSDSRRFVLADTIDQREVEAWEVPETFVDPATAQDTPLLPGEYVRHIAISSPNRGSVFALGSVAFVVKDSCPD